MAPNYSDLELRKSVHINLTKETHSALRMRLFQLRLSMQEVLEECAIKIVEDNPDFVQLLQALQHRKKERKIQKLTQTDAESIFQAIEEQNPLVDFSNDSGE